MRRHRVASTVALAVLALAACGGEDDPSTAGSDTAAEATDGDDATTGDGGAAGTGDGGDEPGDEAATTGSDDQQQDDAADAAPDGDLDDVTWEVRELANGLDAPIEVVAAPGDDRPVVVEQVGRLRLLDGGDVLADLTGRVRARGEQGLLGVAFSPTFADDQRVFVHYSGRDDGRTVLSELRADPDTLQVDEGSEQVLLEVSQPAGNHNGGTVAFGPDGRLHLALGDGGAADDRFGNGQRTDTLLGAILRLDVSEPGRAVAPDDNPYVDGGGAPEVLHVGLRNPFRVTFHDDVLVIADVGQDAVEEVDVVPADATGLNLGWPVLEGDACFAGPCDDLAPFVAPATTYAHRDTGGCSVIGGAVYGGDVAPLRDHYVYGDFCSGLVRSFRIDGTSAVDERDWTSAVGPLNQLTSFSGVAGELYATIADGRVLQLVPDLG